MTVPDSMFLATVMFDVILEKRPFFDKIEILLIGSKDRDLKQDIFPDKFTIERK